MKYVILSVKEEKLGFTRVYPFVFAEYCTHKFVAEYMIHMLGMKEDKDAKVSGAGFCHLHKGEWQTDHGSESLGIKKDIRQGYKDHVILNMPNALQGIILDA